MKKISVFRKFGRRMSAWYIVTLIVAALVLLPTGYVLLELVRPESENWAHVKEYLLADYVIGSLQLVSVVGISATLIGVVFAWLIAAYDFPMRKIFRWALVLPLAVPPYIAAYTYSTMTSYTGFIQSYFRNTFDYQFVPGSIEVMSTKGAMFILTLFLFPYVYMITLGFLEKQSASYIENAKLLGVTGFKLFIKVAIPIAWPAIIAGGTLVAFEVLSDYGVSSFFGVQTISTAIFQTWFGLYDISSAMRLASWLIIILIGLFVMERFLRKRRKYHITTSQNRQLKLKKLSKSKGIIAFLSCSFLLLVAFVIPLVQIIVWTLMTYKSVWRAEFIQLLINSLTGAFFGSLIIIIITLLTARTINVFPSTFSSILARMMTAGYAVPGAVIAIGVLAIFIRADEVLLSLKESYFGVEMNGMVLSLSLGMLITGYVIRFIAPSFNAVDAGFEKIPRTYREASQLLGKSAAQTFFKIELPLLRNVILIGFVLAFLEIMKELPLTLLLRPFNFDTLATRTYQYAIDERIYEAALPSLILIVLSILSVFIILKFEEKVK